MSNYRADTIILTADTHLFTADNIPSWDVSKLVVVKNFHKTGCTGLVTQDLIGYHDTFTLDKIILTLISGTPTFIQAGWSPAGQEAAFLTDISSLQLNTPISLSVEQPPPPTAYTLYMNLFSAVYTIDLLLIRRIGAIYEGDIP